MTGYTIGVDVGGTKVAAGVVDADGTIIASLREPTPASDRDAIDEAVDALEPDASTNAEAGLTLGYSLADRMHNSEETERKVVRNELAKINRTRLERMLGPEGGYSNW